MEIEAKVDKVLLPGDVLGSIDEDLPAFVGGARIRLGPGLSQVERTVIASKAGILRVKPQSGRFHVDGSQKRYVPAKDELVIGVITDKLGESYKVDIGAAAPATLSYLAFEGATKRNRPSVQVGSLVYGKLSVANKDMEPELVCVDEVGRSVGMGELLGGYMITVSSRLTRRLLAADSAILNALGKHFPLETAIGMNGRTWINAQTPQQIVLVANAIANSEFMSPAQINAMVARLVQSL